MNGQCNPNESAAGTPKREHTNQILIINTPVGIDVAWAWTFFRAHAKVTQDLQEIGKIDDVILVDIRNALTVIRNLIPIDIT